jgi:heptosyltransferase II
MRILIVNVNWIGDILFSTLLIRAIKKSFPDSYLATLVPKNGAQLLKENPYLNDIIEFDPFKERGSVGLDIPFLKKIKGFDFTHSLHLHRSLSRRLYAYFGGIKDRIGYNEKLGSFLLTETLPSQRDKIHRALYYFNLGIAMGVVDDRGGLDIFIKDSELKSAQDTLAAYDIKRFCLIHIGANWEAKRWPLGHYVELIERLRTKHNLRIILTGTEKDIKDADYILSRSGSQVLSLVAKTSLRELIALIKLSRLSLTVDSAPLHIAVALNTPLIGIFGPTDPNITGPFRPSSDVIILKENSGCSIPCYKEHCCYQYKCMSQIKPQAVLDAFDKILR